jgi:hypothetical protein
MLGTSLQAPRAAPAPPQAAPAAPSAAAAAVGVSEALSRLADEEDGDLAVPLWFKVEAFTAPEFDADEYVRDLRRYVRAPRPASRANAVHRNSHRPAGRRPPQVPLETLRAELDKHLTTLKNEARAASPLRRCSARRAACLVCAV